MLVKYTICTILAFILNVGPIKGQQLVLTKDGKTKTFTKNIVQLNFKSIENYCCQLSKATGTVSHISKDSIFMNLHKLETFSKIDDVDFTKILKV